MSTGAGADVQRRLEVLIRDFGTSNPPMPVVVLHADDDAEADDRAVVDLVHELHTGQDAHGTRCAVAPERQEATTEIRRAAGLVRDLGDPKRWDGRRSIYRRYGFPRLRLVRAIEDAVSELGPDWPRATPAAGTRDPAQRLLDQLAQQRWRPKGTARWNSGLPLFDMAHVLPASLVAGLAALLARSHWSVALAAGVGFLLLLVLLDNVLPGRAPIFLWLRRESRWFMTTTFLRAASRGRPTDVSLLRPARSWNAIAARAYDVAETLKTGDDFQLQLYVLALLEDLRDNHRRWSWDLRGFKRPRPPVLFLPYAGAENGGIELIKAVSDVRSRRSELDPLLIIAAVRIADMGRLQRGSRIQAPGGTPWIWYQEWARNLRAGQSPSRELAELPWVLKVPLPGRRLVEHADGQPRCVKATTRRTPVRVLWSLHSLVLVLALLAVGVGMRADDLSDRYCSASVLTANRDTQRRDASEGGTECIGIATGDVRFADWPGDGKPSDRGRKPAWTVRQLEERVHTENEEVLDSGEKYVTVIYAGPLSATPSEGPSPLKGIEELAGVYLAQSVINDISSVRLRVMLANGGADMLHQVAMAEAVAEYAAHDRTVVGVVGMGRDLSSSARTTEILRRAGLPVVSGTNSATYLPRQFANWFGLASTDEWQVDQLGLIAAQLRKPGTVQHALVLARDTGAKGDTGEAGDAGETRDLYTTEQAKYGQRMLGQRGFRTLPQRKYRIRGGKPEFRQHTEEMCQGGSVPSVIYFAGRVEHIPALMAHLGTEPGCAQRRISIITGDDLSKANFADNGHGVPPKVTLYHSALAELEKAAVLTKFYRDAEEHLPGMAGRRLSFDTPAIASGQSALAHDATQALYSAATRGGAQTRAATWVNLRMVKLGGMATGTIDFKDAPMYADRTGHSIALKEVRRSPDGASRSRVVCSRVAGDAKPLTVGECAIHQPD